MILFLTGILGFFFCLGFTTLWIVLSRRLSAFQQIREEGPKEHKERKQAIPTMGGIPILLSIALATLPFWNRQLLLTLGIAAACGLLGFSDDLMKLIRGKNLGLKARYKFLGQIGIGFLLALGLQKTGMAQSSIWVPFLGAWTAGKLFIPFVIFVLVATTNAVNLTDGLDGLAAGTTAILAFLFFILASFLKPAPSEAFFSIAMAGAAIGFLWFNGYPARIFMGDAGSLALGGGLCALAFQTNSVFLLPVAGGIFVAETVSVILQVLYFRLTGGKRIFRMTPLHHHFELGGIPESLVTLRFWIVTVFLSLLSLYLAVYA